MQHVFASLIPLVLNARQGIVKLLGHGQVKLRYRADPRLAGVRHLPPFRKCLRAKLAVRSCTDQMPAQSEQVTHHPMNCEKSLCLSGGLGSTHLSLPLMSRLVGVDLCRKLTHQLYRDLIHQADSRPMWHLTGSGSTNKCKNLSKWVNPACKSTG